MTGKKSAADAATEQMTTLFEDWQKAGLGAWAWANPAWFRQVTEINSEIARFVADRLRQDLEFQSEVLQCRDPLELREIHGRFIRDAFDQYSAETGKLVQMNRAALDAATGRDAGG